MNFGVSDNSCMFVTFLATGTKANEKNGHFYVLLTTLIYKIRLFKSHVSRYFSKVMVPVARMRGEQSFLFSNNSNFVDTMPQENKDLKCDAIVVSTSQPKRTISKLEKEIIAIQKKVSKLQDECKNERNEKGKSQSKLEKDEKSFGYSKNVRMFAAFNTTRTNCIIGKDIFIFRHFLSKNKTVGLPDAFLPMCNYVRVVTNGRLDSLSLFNSFKFIIK